MGAETSVEQISSGAVCKHKFMSAGRRTAKALYINFYKKEK